jgi:hypothetical protein
MTTKAQLHFCVCLIGHTDLHNLQTVFDTHHSAQFSCLVGHESKRAEATKTFFSLIRVLKSHLDHSQSEEHGFIL